MTAAESRQLACGLYRVFWVSGGMSFAAVGAAPNGERWLAPTNWTSPVVPYTDWEQVASMELIVEGWGGISGEPADTEPHEIVEWHGCYDQGWKGILVDAAFAHPAKASRALLGKIFDTLFERGWLKKGDRVVDPFGGIGTTGLIGATRGVKVFSCELEAKFFELAGQNYAKHAATYAVMGYPPPTFVNGDSRKLREHLRLSLELDAAVSSPPYAEIASGAGGLNTKDPREKGQQSGRSSESPSQATDQRYGDADGQLAKMPSGDVSAVIASPPYSEQVSYQRPGAGGENFELLRAGFSPQEIKAMRQAGDPRVLDTRRNAGYSRSPENLGNMPAGDIDGVVSSPPFTQGYQGGGGINKRGYNPAGGEGTDKVGDRSYQGTGADRSAGNLETMEFDGVDGVISSPPYESQPTKNGGTLKPWAGKRRVGASQNNNDGYGGTLGQLGGERGETFWTAARDIVRESYAILKPGGYAVWIVKHFVRDKKLVDFPGDWRRLCEHVGFECVLEARAMLVRETRTPDLFGGEKVERKERKSFFRRLAESKGSPRIDFETVLFMRRIP